MTISDVQDALKGVKYLDFDKDIVSFGFVKNITINGLQLALRVEIPSASEENKARVYSDIQAALKPLDLKKLDIDIIAPKPSSEQGEQGGGCGSANHEVVHKNLAPSIKHTIMISSGKGGVGKSTTSVNLALALAQQGLKVGLLDADIYGPNLPRMLGRVNAKVEVDESGKRLLPIDAYGVHLMSIGLIYEEGALIWRGPMVMRAIEQLLSDVAWGDLDILVIDMPPGTGDAQLSLAQNLPISLGVTVTTPQAVSLDDSARSLDMFVKMDIPLGGIVENMSGFVCPNCSHETDIFSKGGASLLAKSFGTEVLASIPLEASIRESMDAGKPLLFFAPSSVVAKRYKELAFKLAKKLGL